MPLYSGMAQSSVTGWPAITTWSCGCCVNEDAWPGRRKKEQASVLKSIFHRMRQLEMQRFFSPGLKKWYSQEAPGTSSDYFIPNAGAGVLAVMMNRQDLLGRGDILFYSKYKRMLVENQDAQSKTCYKTLRKTPDRCCFLFSQSIFATSISLALPWLKNIPVLNPFFPNERCSFQSGKRRIWDAQI